MHSDEIQQRLEERARETGSSIEDITDLFGLIHDRVHQRHDPTPKQCCVQASDEHGDWMNAFEVWVIQGIGTRVFHAVARRGEHRGEAMVNEYQ